VSDLINAVAARAGGFDLRVVSATDGVFALLGSPAGPVGSLEDWRKPSVRAVRTGLQTTVGLGYGKVSVAGGAAMNAYENNGLFGRARANRALLDAAEQQMFDTKSGPVDAVTFQRFLHRAVQGNWVKNGSLYNAKR
jgi:hypothetical protein